MFVLTKCVCEVDGSFFSVIKASSVHGHSHTHAHTHTNTHTFVISLKENQKPVCSRFAIFTTQDMIVKVSNWQVSIVEHLAAGHFSQALVETKTKKNE